MDGQSYLLPRVPGNADIWPQFRAKLPFLSQQFDVAVDELALGINIVVNGWCLH